MQTQKVKIIFKLDQNDWHNVGSETVWATLHKEGLARIENSPFYMKGVNYLDLVNIKPLNESMAEFESVVNRSGHSTYRIITNLQVSDQKFIEYWKPLQELGCSFESSEGDKTLLAVDVPPDSDIHKVYRLLEKGEKEKIWSFEEGLCVHV